MMENDNFFSKILIAILYFVLGAVFFATTEELLRTFNYILVCICLIIGVIQMIGFFLGKKSKNGDYTDLLIGIVFVWVSLILYVYYGFMINILPILFSLYLFIMAVSLFVKYRNGIHNGKYLILGLVALLVGMLLIFNPGSMIFVYLKVTGIYLILVSVVSFMECFRRKGN